MPFLKYVGNRDPSSSVNAIVLETGPTGEPTKFVRLNEAGDFSEEAVTLLDQFFVLEPARKDEVTDHSKDAAVLEAQPAAPAQPAEPTK